MTELSLILASLFAIYLALVLPLLGPWSYRRFLKRVAINPARRARVYLLMMAEAWFQLIVVGIVALLGSLSLSTFGLRAPYYAWLQALYAPPVTSWIFTLFLLIGLWLLMLVGVNILEHSLEKLGRIDRLPRLLRLKELLPHTSLERRLWLGVSIGAGVCEEIVYRGFLPWYLQQSSNFLGLRVSFLLALALSTIVFALVHSYQGWRGILSAGLLGYVFAFFYYATGSLLFSIVFHILIDARIVLLSPTILRMISRHE